MYSITKTKIECYKIRKDDGIWADITIDALDKTGRIQIASDFGDYQYYWGACSKDFKGFLISLNLDYVAGKFGVSNWFDCDESIEYIRLRINNNYNSDEHKRLLLEEFNELKNASCKDEFFHIIQNSENIMEMEDNMPSLCYNIDPKFKRFWNEIWTIFINELKNEINETV